MLLVGAGAERVRHRALRRVVRGVHGGLRARGAAARAAAPRAAQPQDAGRLAAGQYRAGSSASPSLDTETPGERLSSITVHHQPMLVYCCCSQVQSNFVVLVARGSVTSLSGTYNYHMNRMFGTTFAIWELVVSAFEGYKATSYYTSIYKANVVLNTLYI